MQETNQPLLSICIPTLNRAEILRETLNHLAEVLDPSFEIVVSNNCSCDHTVEVLEDFKKKWKTFQYITQSKEITAMENRVAATLMAQGKYLYNFSDDDRLYIESLSKAVRMMEEREDVVAVFGGHQEWDSEKNVILGTIPRANEILVFPKGLESKLKVFQEVDRLLFPVARTEICRRFCVDVYNKYSFGMWPFVGRLLDHGAVAVLPDIFYKHGHTESRAEHDLTEGWIHDMYRADFELFIGKMGRGSINNATFISRSTASAYLQGVRFALIKEEWLTGRSFLLRARAYGLVSDEQLLEYEKHHIVEMVAERIKALVSIAPGIRRVIIESHPISEERLRSSLAKIMPEMDICVVSREELLDCPTKPEEFIVAWDYQTLLERSGRFEEDPLRQHSLMDIFGNCRLLSGELAFT
jgi:glycosyltransferase involved in cell wall biosynthesis